MMDAADMNDFSTQLVTDVFWVIMPLNVFLLTILYLQMTYLWRDDDKHQTYKLWNVS